MKPLRLLTVFALVMCCSGCASSSYLTPGAPADMTVFTELEIKKAFESKPALRFPANLAVVRVQGAGYSSESVRGTGSGAYSVITTREIETEADIARLMKLKQVEGVTTLNRLLLPKRLSSDAELREAAAKLHTDVILIYTVDTTFRDRDIIPPLTTISLGLAPNRRFHVNATAAGILMDTKTGFIYGAIEEGQTASGVTMAWGDRNAIEASRLKTERLAFEKLLVSFESLWPRICERYQK